MTPSDWSLIQKTAPHLIGCLPTPKKKQKKTIRNEVQQKLFGGYFMTQKSHGVSYPNFCHQMPWCPDFRLVLWWVDLKIRSNHPMYPATPGVFQQPTDPTNDILKTGPGSSRSLAKNSWRVAQKYYTSLEFVVLTPEDLKYDMTQRCWSCCLPYPTSFSV